MGKLTPPKTSGLTAVPPEAPQSSSSGGTTPVRKSFLKVPKASQLSPQTVPAPSRPKPKPQEAPIQVEIRKYTNNASLFVSSCPTVPLWQLQVVHAATPSVTYDIVRNFNDFLAVQHATDPQLPNSLASLYADNQMKLVITDPNDPDDVGFVNWRIAFYIAGQPPDSVNFAINLLGSFFYHRQQTETQRPLPNLTANYIVTTLAACTVVADTLDVSSTVINSDKFTLPFNAAAPPFGRRLICCVVDFEGATISAVITGNAYPFRAALDAADIGGDYGPTDDKGHREYYRVISPQDATTFDLSATPATVFSGSIILCSVRTPPPADSPGSIYVKDLQDKPNVSILPTTP